MRHLAVFCLFLLPTVAAAVPAELTYQGRLIDAAGAPVNGTRDVDVVLFDAASGGTNLYETQVSTPIQDGYFTTSLTPDTSDLASDVWVEVRLDNSPLGPRTRLASVPFARVAGTVEQVPPIVHRLASHFAGATLTSVVVRDGTDHAKIELLTLDRGDGSDGNLIVTSGVHVDNGAPKDYATVSVTGGARVEVTPWNGTSGGTLNWKVLGDVTVGSGSSIDVSGAGYRGGLGNETTASSAGAQGESPTGFGVQGAIANGGGGGGGPAGNASGGGGGGGYGTGGNNGFAGTGGAGIGGGVYGDVQLTTLHLGAGGGGGSLDSNGTGTRSTGVGGRGGGAIRIVASNIFVAGTLRSNGANGGNNTCATTCGSNDDAAAGGGSGGSIYLTAVGLSLSGTVTATGGAGGLGNHDSNASAAYFGGSGGNGRIRLDSGSFTGATTPAAGFTQTVSADVGEGTFTSAVVDGGANPPAWGAFVWDNSSDGTVLAQVRTGSQANLSDAVAWASAPYLANGQPLVGVSSVRTGDRYAQYRFTLRGTANNTPSVRSVVFTR